MPECSYSNIEQQTSKWLTKNFMKDILRIHYKDPNLEVVSITIAPAVGKGHNFASVIWRVWVRYKVQSDRDRDHETRTELYIVKSSFEGDEFASEKMKAYNVFDREMAIYEKIIPKLNALLEEIGDSDKLFPEIIALDYDHKAIVLEDLCQRNFIMCDKTKGLDMDHTRLCLRKLAKMHATSAVLNEREPGTFDGYDRGMFNRYTNAYSSLFIGLLEACGQMVSEMEGFEQYGRKLLALKPKLMEYGKQVFDVIDTHMNVFVHGDFWNNNILFIEEANHQPTDAILLDLQYCCWGSPAIDLHYLFQTSLREEIRLHQLDELFQYYYNILRGTLKALNFQGKIPSLHQFQLQMAEKGFYTVTSLLIQAIQLNEQNDDADFNALMGDDERARNFKKLIFQNERVQKNLKRLLPMLDRKGLLDIRD